MLNLSLRKGCNSMIKKRILTGFLCFLVFLSFTPLFSQWARTYGDDWEDEWPFSVRQTSDGGYIVAGRTDSFGAGGTDFWILKLDSEGLVEWQHTYGGAGDDYAICIQQTGDGGYIVAGGTDSFGAGGYDAWILKLDSAGNIDWQYTYGGTGGDFPNCIKQTSDGGYIVAGDTDSFGAGGYDAWILKLDSTGNIEWGNTQGGTGDDYASSIQQTSDGGYIVVGDTDSFGAGGSDFWVVKLNSDGSINWQNTYGGTGDEYAYSTQQTSDGGYIVAGFTDSFGAGNFDIWVLKLDSTGAVDWQKTYGGIYNEFVYYSAVQQTTEGGYIIGGITFSFGAGEADFWALKLDSNGVVEWQNTYGGTENDFGQGIRQTSDSGYVFSGDSNSFHPLPDTDYDWLILKLHSGGDIDTACGINEVSTASPSATAISAAATSATLQDLVGVTPNSTSVSPQTTSVTARTVCGGPLFDLTISASAGGTTDPAPDTYSIYSGAQVGITAIPYTGYDFSNWSGDASGTTNPTVITMDDIKTVTANFVEAPDDGDENGGGGGLCFIATAAYGSPLHPHVKILRDFRDKYLMPSKLGRECVDLYKKYSPLIANSVAKHKAVRLFVQVNLTSVVIFSYSMVHLGPIVTGGILLLILAIPLFLHFRKSRSG